MLAFPVARVGHGANVEARLSSRRGWPNLDRERAASETCGAKVQQEWERYVAAQHAYDEHGCVVETGV